MRAEYSNKKIRDISELKLDPNITVLDLSDNIIEKIIGLEHLTELIELYLDRNRIALIENLDASKKLEVLSMNGDSNEGWGIIGVKEIGSGLENLTELRRLSLRYPGFTKIKGLDKLRKLEVLDIQDGGLEEISGLDNLTSLKELDLSCTGQRGYLKTIPEIKGLDNLVNLRKLDLSNNLIKEIKGLNNLRNLEELNLSSNEIPKIKGLDNLSNLKVLVLTSSIIYSESIQTIEGLDNLKQLQELYLSGNRITEIKGLDNLTNLKRLSLGHNSITEIKGLDKLVSLQVLDLSGNRLWRENKLIDSNYRLWDQISEIKGLDNLTNLEELYISDNSIKKIEGLDRLVNLKKLYLPKNQITEIENLDKLTDLEELNLWGNSISEIKGLENLFNLREINLSDNPLGIACLEKLLEYKHKGYLPKLESINLVGTKIDWYDIKAGNLAWELKKLGIEIKGDNVKYIPPTPYKKESLEEHLSKKLGLDDRFVSSVVSWFEKEGTLENLSKNSQISANKVFRVKTKEGKPLVIKITSDKRKAEVEQAANFYLPQNERFQFIVPADNPTPFEYNLLYVTSQYDVSEHPDAQSSMDLAYYLKSMAILHAHGAEILRNAGVNIQHVRVRDSYKLIDEISERDKKILTKYLDLSRLDRKRYDEYAARLLQSGNSSLILKDPRSDNRKGKFLIDLENLSIGDSSMDLVMFTHDTALGMQEEERRGVCNLYYRLYCEEKGIEHTEAGFKRFLDNFDAALYVVAGSELNALLKEGQINDPEKLKRLILFARKIGVNS